MALSFPKASSYRLKSEYKNAEKDHHFVSLCEDKTNLGSFLAINTDYSISIFDCGKFVKRLA